MRKLSNMVFAFILGQYGRFLPTKSTIEPPEPPIFPPMPPVQPPIFPPITLSKIPPMPPAQPPKSKMDITHLSFIGRRENLIQIITITKNGNSIELNEQEMRILQEKITEILGVRDD